MDDAGRLEALELMLREAQKRAQAAWREKAEAQVDAARWLYIQLIWWPQRKPDLSAYDSDELPAAVDAYRAGKEPPPPRRAKLDAD